jgi:hypothetical protein
VEAGNKKSKPAQAAENFARKLQTGQEIAQAAIASAQQKMEDSANKTRQQAAIFRKKRLRVIKSEKYKNPLAIKKAILV